MPDIPFVAPNWGSVLGKSIEGGFDDIMNGLAMRRKNQEGDLAFTASTGYNRDNLLKGQAIDQELRDGTIPNVSGGGPGGVRTNPQPSPEMSTADQGMWGEYQNFNNAMKSMQGAKVSGAMADARMKTAHANLYDSMANHPKPVAGTLPDNVLRMAEAEALTPGSFPVDLVGGRGADRAAYEAAVRDAAVRHGVEYSGGAASAILGGARQAAKTPEEAGFRLKQATADALLPQLATLRNMSKFVPRESWQTINKYGLKYAVENNDIHANNLDTQINQVALNMQSLYPTGSNEKLDIDLKNLSGAKSHEALDGAVRIIAKDIVNTRNARARVDPNTMSDFEKSLDIYPQTEEQGATPSGLKKDLPPLPKAPGKAKDATPAAPKLDASTRYKQLKGTQTERFAQLHAEGY